MTTGLIDALLSSRRPVPQPTKTIGAMGTPVYGGFVQSLEESAALSGTTRYRTFSDNLANISIVAASLRLYLNMLSRAKWIVEPADESRAAHEVAELIDSIIRNSLTPWHRIVRRASMYRMYGFSIQEWTAFLRSDGVIGFSDIAPRPQVTIERWDVDQTGFVRGVWQVIPQTGTEIYLPREKIIYVVDDSISDSPEGLGLFRHIAEDCRKLLRYQQLEGWGFETDLRGMPIGRSPRAALYADGQNATQVAAAEADLRAFIQNHVVSPQRGVILDSAVYTTTDERGSPSAVRQWDLEVVKSAVTTAAEVGVAIKRLTHNLARVFGTEGLLLGSDSSGSRALSQDKSNTLALIIESALVELSETFDHDLFVPLAELNGWDPELLPCFKTESLRTRDVTDLATALRDVAASGVMLDRADEAIGELFDLMGLSRPEARPEDDAALALDPRQQGETEDDDEETAETGDQDDVREDT